MIILFDIMTPNFDGYLKPNLVYTYTGFGQNNGNTWKFQTNLFYNGFLIAALAWNPALCSSLLDSFEETGFSRRSLSSVVIFVAVFLWSLLTIHVRVQLSLSDSFRFFPEFCICGEGIPSFSNAVITFETIFLASPNNSAVFVTLTLAIRAPAIDLFKVW